MVDSVSTSTLLREKPDPPKQPGLGLAGSNTKVPQQITQQENEPQLQTEVLKSASVLSANPNNAQLSFTAKQYLYDENRVDRKTPQDIHSNADQELIGTVMGEEYDTQPTHFDDYGSVEDFLYSKRQKTYLPPGVSEGDAADRNVSGYTGPVSPSPAPIASALEIASDVGELIYLHTPVGALQHTTGFSFYDSIDSKFPRGWLFNKMERTAKEQMSTLPPGMRSKNLNDLLERRRKSEGTPRSEAVNALTFIAEGAVDLLVFKFVSMVGSALGKLGDADLFAIFSGTRPFKRRYDPVTKKTQKILDEIPKRLDEDKFMGEPPPKFVTRPEAGTFDLEGIREEAASLLSTRARIQDAVSESMATFDGPARLIRIKDYLARPGIEKIWNEKVRLNPNLSGNEIAEMVYKEVEDQQIALMILKRKIRIEIDFREIYGGKTAGGLDPIPSNIEDEVMSDLANHFLAPDVPEFQFRGVTFSKKELKLFEQAGLKRLAATVDQIKDDMKRISNIDRPPEALTDIKDVVPTETLGRGELESGGPDAPGADDISLTGGADPSQTMEAIGREVKDQIEENLISTDQLPNKGIGLRGTVKETEELLGRKMTNKELNAYKNKNDPDISEKHEEILNKIRTELTNKYNPEDYVRPEYTGTYTPPTVTPTSGEYVPRSVFGNITKIQEALGRKLKPIERRALKSNNPEIRESMLQKLRKEFTEQESGTIKFTESSSSGYRERTMRNASADATIALAADFNSAGERLTKRAVLEQGKEYIAIDISKELKVTKEIVEGIVRRLNDVNAESLNIAGNSLHTLKSKYNQERLDKFTHALLKRVSEHPNLKNKITKVVTGGQTGMDEAGAKAAAKLGIKTEIHAPKGYKFRTSGGKDISNESHFKSRFEELRKEFKSGDVIEFYSRGPKEYRFMSNFADTPFEYKGKTYKTSEHFYQASKAGTEAEHELIRNAPSPSQAKRLGKETNIRKGFNRISIMKRALIEKFKQNPKLKIKLLETGDRKLVENNPYDSFWGIGRDGEGKNQMGKLLEELREHFRKESKHPIKLDKSSRELKSKQYRHKSAEEKIKSDQLKEKIKARNKEFIKEKVKSVSVRKLASGWPGQGPRAGLTNVQYARQETKISSYLGRKLMPIERRALKSNNPKIREGMLKKLRSEHNFNEEFNNAQLDVLFTHLTPDEANLYTELVVNKKIKGLESYVTARNKVLKNPQPWSKLTKAQRSEIRGRMNADVSLMKSEMEAVLGGKPIGEPPIPRSFEPKLPHKERLEAYRKDLIAFDQEHPNLMEGFKKEFPDFLKKKKGDRISLKRLEQIEQEILIELGEGISSPGRRKSVEEALVRFRKLIKERKRNK